MIATVCDEGAFLLDVAQYAVRSVARHMPDHRFCLVLINGTGRYDDQIRSWHPRLILKHYPMSIREEFRRGYQFCYMTLPLHDLLLECDEPLIYIDADTILRGSLQPIFESLETSEFIIRYIPSQELPGPTTATEGARVNNGLTALANNPITREFTRELRSRVVRFLEAGKNPLRELPDRGVITGLDQELLWVIYLEMADRLKFFPLSDRFNDAHMRADSVLWHAKGTARRHVRYRRAVARESGDTLTLLRTAPRAAAWTLFEHARSWRRRKNLRAAYTLPDPVPTARNLLVLNSQFLVHNPALLSADRITCFDIDPVHYHANAEAVVRIKKARHHYTRDLLAINASEFDLTIWDHHPPPPNARALIRQTRDLSEHLQWRNTLPWRAWPHHFLADLYEISGLKGPHHGAAS